MVDILLIQPPIEDFYLTPKRTVPYGLACIASPLIQAGFSVEILDALASSKARVVELPPEMQYLRSYYPAPDLSPFGLFYHYRHFGYSLEHLDLQLRNSGAFLVGISSLFTAYSKQALQLARMAKQARPGCYVVMGGHHPTALPESVMTEKAVDFCIRGEGELPLLLLAKQLKAKKSVDNIPGIVFRTASGLKISKPHLAKELDKNLLPARSLIKNRFYRRGKKHSTVIVAARGCPMRCSYCCLSASSAISYRCRSVESVMCEIRQAIYGHPLSFLDFEDENISLNKIWFLSLLKEISHLPDTCLELRAMNGLLPTTLDEEIVEAMSKAGFKALNLALATTNARQLEKFQRADVTKALLKSIAFAKKYGMECVSYIIAGAPGQNPYHSLEDLIFVARTHSIVGLSIYYPAPDSQDYELCQRKSLLPGSYSLMRSTAIPISDTTTRLQSVTLLRLARIINFLKTLPEQDRFLPGTAEKLPKKLFTDDRVTLGKRLLSHFAQKCELNGINPQGEIFQHKIDKPLCKEFIRQMNQLEWRI